MCMCTYEQIPTQIGMAFGSPWRWSPGGSKLPDIGAGNSSLVFYFFKSIKLLSTDMSYFHFFNL